MRTLTIIILLSLAITRAYPTDELDIGIFGGTSYYMGNINTSQHFYNLSPALGIVLKHNLNEHYSVRFNMNYGQVRADDTDFDNIFNQTRQAIFTTRFYDFSFQGEFNFQPFKVTIINRPVSSYLTAGIAYTFIPSDGAYSDNFLNIPFGVGVKYGISRKITIGLEWILKKNFTDNIDGIKSFGQFNSPSLVHNNDWVSLAGFILTIKPFERKGDCPVYWN